MRPESVPDGAAESLRRESPGAAARTDSGALGDAGELTRHRAAYDRLAADARNVLGTWTAPTRQQERVRLEMLEVLKGGGAVMAKAGPPAHFTAGLIVLDPGLDAVLLTHHRKADRWFQFGGHFEPEDDTVRAAAVREGREESGIEDLVAHGDLVHVDRHALPSAFGTCREHLDLRFAAIAPTGSTHVVSDESLDVRWWPIRDLPSDAAQDLGEFIECARMSLSAKEIG